MEHGTHAPRRLIAVHVGHLAIHEDQIESFRAQELERLRAGARDPHGAVEALEQALRDILIGRMILDHENPARRIFQNALTLILQRLFVGSGERQRDAEGRPARAGVDQYQVATHRLGEAP
jgi:hypothetical protein